ncbi:MAG: hypothetical protein KDB27_32620, partial [Planctomycetales bacterium]|nr:hypothetical protein [Planctomycetales bacterium]
KLILAEEESQRDVDQNLLLFAKQRGELFQDLLNEGNEPLAVGHMQNYVTALETLTRRGYMLEEVQKEVVGPEGNYGLIGLLGDWISIAPEQKYRDLLKRAEDLSQQIAEQLKPDDV